MAHLSPFFSVGIIGHAREDGLSWDQGHWKEENNCTNAVVR
jgi:hypothetical protein